LKGHHSQHMQRIEMPRLFIQNLQIDALHGRQILLPMQRQPLPESGLQCRRSLVSRDDTRVYFVNSAKAPFQSSGGGFSWYPLIRASYRLYRYSSA
jgi:hypothetical protein